MRGFSVENVPLIAVVGPTGSGKSALALALAEELGSEIVSVDSMQFYEGMEIGTAAPSLADRQRVPHHFVGFLQPDDEIAAGTYQETARERITLINRGGKTAVAAGGSGMYVSALIDGIFDGPGGDPAIRARLEAEAEAAGNEHMLERLRTVDPAYAAGLTSANDRVRIVRALEVYEIAGRPYSVLHREHRLRAESLPALQFALRYDNRQDLYDRINQRVCQMVDDGWVDEVMRLLDEGYGEQIQRLKALGYREIVAYLRGKQTLNEAISATQMHHRRYAKRQLTWFRADPRIHWLPAGPGVSLAEQLDALRAIAESQKPVASSDGGPMHRYLQANAAPPAADVDAPPLGEAMLTSYRSRFENARTLGEGALAQLAEGDWHRCDGPEDNSIAIIVQHLHGNMLSRWTDFLTSDGEKESRDRDGEFTGHPGLSPEELWALWNAGWDCVLRALHDLRPEDLVRTVTIRRQPLLALDAVNRQLGHYNYHVGQIVQLARHFRGNHWRTLSIGRGASKAYKARAND